MRILVDVDDTLANLVEEWLRLYRIDYDDNLSSSDITDWDISKFVKPECGKDIYDYLTRSDLYDNVKPIDLTDSLFYIKLLRQCNHRIIFATTAVISHAGQKYRWLQKYGFLPKDELIPINYCELGDKTLLNVDVIVDDKILTVEQFAKMGKVSFLFDRPHNHKYNNYPYGCDDFIYRIYNFEGLFNIISKMSDVR